MYSKYHITIIRIFHTVHFMNNEKKNNLDQYPIM